MSVTVRRFAAPALAGAVALLGACGRPHAAHLTVADLMEDRVTRDGVLMKCNRSPALSDTDIDCLNVRVAIERIAAEKEKADAAAREAQFERRREQLRLAEEARRQAREAASKVDPYSLPVVPVTPNATTADAPISAEAPAGSGPPAVSASAAAEAPPAAVQSP